MRLSNVLALYRAVLEHALPAKHGSDVHQNRLNKRFDRSPDLVNSFAGERAARYHPDACAGSRGCGIRPALLIIYLVGAAAFDQINCLRCTTIEKRHTRARPPPTGSSELGHVAVGTVSRSRSQVRMRLRAS